MKYLTIPLSIAFSLLISLFGPAVGARAAALIDIGVGSGSTIIPSSTSSVETETNIETNASLTGESATSSRGSESSGIVESSDESIVISNDGPIKVLRNDVNIGLNAESTQKIKAGESTTTEKETQGDADIEVIGEGMGVPSMSADEVLNTSDLKNFATTLLEEDENFEGAIFNHDSVEVRYREPGKLLGIIPMGLIIRAVAHADESVELNYPWYAFLVAADKDELKAELENAVKASLERNAMAGVNTNGEVVLTAPEAARLALEMKNVFEARYDARYAEENSSSTPE